MKNALRAIVITAIILVIRPSQSSAYWHYNIGASYNSILPGGCVISPCYRRQTVVYNRSRYYHSPIYSHNYRSSYYRDRHCRTYPRYNYYYRKPYRPYHHERIIVDPRNRRTTRYTRTIPDVVVIERQKREIELVQPPTYKTREQFLIDTMMTNATAKRKLAAEELADYKSVTSVAALVDILINDTSVEVQIVAANSLMTISNPMAYEPLLRLSRSCRDVKLREKTTEAAVELRSRTDSGFIHVSNQNPIVRHGIADLSYDIEEMRYGRTHDRESAVKSMRKYKDSRAVAVLINALINDKDNIVRKEAAKSLEQIGDRMALPFLRAARENDNDKAVRRAAGDAAEEMHETVI